MNAYIYIEGGAHGADSKNLKIRCQEAFHKLLDRMGFRGRQPRLVACGGRQEVYDRFCIEHASRMAAYVAMWIDSEEPVSDTEATWNHLEHLTTVGPWQRPEGTADDQVLLMTTCMETWIVADRPALCEHYGARLQKAALPPLVQLESRGRHDVQRQLEHATRNCTNAYEKGKRSFEVFAKLTPAALEGHLPSFARVCRVLNARL